MELGSESEPRFPHSASVQTQEGKAVGGGRKGWRRRALECALWILVRFILIDGRKLWKCAGATSDTTCRLHNSRWSHFRI